ncbi:MAG: glutamate--cysteine ligase [Hyphomicrobiales bacterium]|nr:glutamate--cysteine ligase [Hyphomicrobiales bacterium]
MGYDLSAKAPIESRDQLVAWLEAGVKTDRSSWRIGTEHEKLGFHVDDLSPLGYEGPVGVRAMLEGLRDHFGWQPIMEKGNIIGLKDPAGGASITLEPGGQFELSGAPLKTLHETCSEVNSHLEQVRTVAEPLGIGFLGVGFSPLWTRAETPIMPKGRYNIMRAYMPTKGDLGLDMMLRTATVQVNLDFAEERDMVEKLRIGLALQPVATALFANSPFTEGKPNGYLSFRAHIWHDVDPDRTGLLPFVFEDGMGFERYADYALDVPMYFRYRDGQYIDMTGMTFRQFLEKGGSDSAPGARPTIGDWVDHLTTLFPEVRLKRFIEMRGADGGPWRRLCALPAFWVGLLYDAGTQDEALQLVKDWSFKEIEGLRAAVPREGLNAVIGGRTVREVASDVVALSRQGLGRRAQTDDGDDESGFLDTVEDIIAKGRTPAEDLLDEYNNLWGRRIGPLFSGHAY